MLLVNIANLKKKEEYHCQYYKYSKTNKYYQEVFD